MEYIALIVRYAAHGIPEKLVIALAVVVIVLRCNIIWEDTGAFFLV